MKTLHTRKHTHTPWQCSPPTVPRCAGSPDRWLSEGRSCGNLRRRRRHHHHRLRHRNRLRHQAPRRADTPQFRLRDETSVHALRQMLQSLNKWAVTSSNLLWKLEKVDLNISWSFKMSSMYENTKWSSTTKPARGLFIVSCAGSQGWSVTGSSPWPFSLGWFFFQNSTSCCSSPGSHEQTRRRTDKEAARRSDSKKKMLHWPVHWLISCVIHTPCG